MGRTTFAEWSAKFSALAEFAGVDVPDADARIERVCELMRGPVEAEWLRASELDDNKWPSGLRYRRGNLEGNKRGEHQREHEILALHFDRVACLSGKLIDGVNAYPLAQGRSVEADMLLLADCNDGYRQFLVEAKESANNAWYAVVENLRQLKLFVENAAAQRFFHRRNPGLELPEKVEASGMILAPRSFFESGGQKGKSVPPTRRLIEALRRNHLADVRLATWDSETARITELP